MDIQTFILIMATALAIMGWWANYSKRNKIYCSFTREDNTMTRKFLKMKSRYVVFDGRRYDVLPNCIKTLLWDAGFVGRIFPQRLPALDYTYSSRWPIDPKTGKIVILSPETRELMNKEELFRAYTKSYNAPVAKKQTFAQQWLPWMAIGMVALLFFYVYSNNQAFGQALADIANQVNAIAK